jgi:hypothetical protein
MPAKKVPLTILSRFLSIDINFSAFQRWVRNMINSRLFFKLIQGCGLGCSIFLLVLVIGDYRLFGDLSTGGVFQRFSPSGATLNSRPMGLSLRYAKVEINLSTFQRGLSLRYAKADIDVSAFERWVRNGFNSSLFSQLIQGCDLGCSIFLRVSATGDYRLLDGLYTGGVFRLSSPNGASLNSRPRRRASLARCFLLLFACSRYFGVTLVFFRRGAGIAKSLYKTL